MLREWGHEGTWNPLFKGQKVPLTPREIALARDAYDDCIASMDEQLGRLLTALHRLALLDNTLVIVTSDHGEAFVEHNLLGHFNSLYRTEIDVPMLIFFPPAVPAGRTVAEPVSLRSLPATVVDLLGLTPGSQFPGRSLAPLWSAGASPGGTETDPAYSELTETGLQALRAGHQVYIRAGDGSEQLFDVAEDPGETRNLANSETARGDLERFRGHLSRLPGDHPETGLLASMACGNSPHFLQGSPPFEWRMRVAPGFDFIRPAFPVPPGAADYACATREKTALL